MIAQQVIIHRETCEEHYDSDHWIDQHSTCHGNWSQVKRAHPYLRHIGKCYFSFVPTPTPSPDWDAIPLPPWMSDMHNTDAAELSQPEQDW